MSKLNRIIIDDDGEEYDPIPFGEESYPITYGEVVEDYKKQIENGGRGRFGPATVRKELEAFKDQNTPEEYNSRQCHDCGAGMGGVHMVGCDIEQCPICRNQYLSCACRTYED